ncbi:MAG: oligopeptide transporter protein, partial [Pedosphaera sp.]|nr:oligopeptide transporter protein [Pedosphaera sp.]
MAIKTQPAKNADHGLHTYIPPETRMPEFTPRALILGTLLGVVFGASSLYLVLKVGITVSASIPVAVISLALFRLWSKMGGRDATILEHNIVQTAGSAGESIAFGLGVTMPAIMILGFDLEITRVMLVALRGGLLGILMMIPLRRALIVQQHGQLKYPEGTACAELLKAGANDESRAMASEAAQLHAGAMNRARGERGPSATTIFTGFGQGLLYSTAMRAFKLWKVTPEKIFGAPLKAGSISAEISPELLGVGYIIGPRIASIMMGGGVLSYLMLIPLIKFFGDAVVGVVAPGKTPISAMEPDDIRYAYILYIGAGAVAAGGIISLLRSGPIILRGIRAGLSDFGAAAKNMGENVLRTERDLSMKFVAGGVAA